MREFLPFRKYVGYERLAGDGEYWMAAFSVFTAERLFLSLSLSLSLPAIWRLYFSLYIVFCGFKFIQIQNNYHSSIDFCLLLLQYTVLKLVFLNTNMDNWVNNAAQ
jgi:hypothetical protein